MTRTEVNLFPCCLHLLDMSTEIITRLKRIILVVFQGISLKHKIKAIKYVECSALSRKGLKNVFDETVRSVLVPSKPRPSHRCSIL